MSACETQQLNVRLPLGTQRQIEELAALYGLSVTQIFILALDRMAAQELPAQEWNRAARLAQTELANRDRAAQPAGAPRAPAQEG